MSLTREEQLMLEDYRATLDLLKHEDERKAQLFTLFIGMNGGLVAFYVWMSDSNTAIAIGLAIAAVIFGIYWFFIMERMRAFIWLRYCLLLKIEDRIKLITSISAEEKLRNLGEVEVYGELYKLAFHQRISVTKTESFIPLVVAVFWLVLAVGGILGFF